MLTQREIDQLIFVADTALMARDNPDLDRSIDWRTLAKILFILKEQNKEVDHE